MRDHSYDAVISRYMLHHIHNPIIFWREIKRLVKFGGVVYVMDLIRPGSPEDARKIVEEVAGKEDHILKEDFYNSLCAAFTPEEVIKQLTKAGLNLSVEKVSNRHIVIKGRMV